MAAHTPFSTVLQTNKSNAGDFQMFVIDHRLSARLNSGICEVGVSIKFSSSGNCGYKGQICRYFG